MYHNRIYIAEHDKDLRSDLKALLCHSGYEVALFDSGYSIVSLMDNWPDVFLLEIELPDINGLEVCKWLKSHPGSRYVPVIFISGDPYLKVLAASVHADGYIEKPLKAATVLRQVRECLLAEKEVR